MALAFAANEIVAAHEHGIGVQDLGARRRVVGVIKGQEGVSKDGRQLRFYTDLLQGKVVLINSFFSSCTDSCPAMAGTLARVQDWLADRLGKEVNIISISVDPVSDTPPVLKQYAQRFKARPGWSFLTGNPRDVNLVLQKLGQYVDAREDHLNVFIIGNERTGLWKKAFGLARPGDIINVVDSVLSDKN